MKKKCTNLQIKLRSENHGLEMVCKCIFEG